MDAPTADNEIVLASMGGAPRVPRSEDQDGESPGTSNSTDGTQEEEKWSAAERGVPREGLRERAGGWSEA